MGPLCEFDVWIMASEWDQLNIQIDLVLFMCSSVFRPVRTILHKLVPNACVVCARSS